MEGANGTGMAESLRGLKLDISPDLLLPRDVAVHSKIFTLIPPNIKTVRELKNHLSMNVLRTTLPFYFYNGEYRIPDEEDVRIFALLTEPCRILPVPQPKSVLSISGSAPASSSTPIGLFNGGTTPKRVKFNEELSISSINGLNTTTKGILSTSLSPVQPTYKQEECSINGKKTRAEKVEGQDNVDGAISPEGKKKRRRRHKAKKKEKVTTETMSSSVESMELDSAEEDKTEVCVPPKAKKRKTKALPAYDADESELGPSQNLSSKDSLVEANGNNFAPAQSPEISGENAEGGKKKDFLSPNTAFSETGYHRLRSSTGNYSNSSEFFKCSPSNSFKKRRQDTPNLPRVLKNPGSVYDIVKKSLNARLEQEEQTEETDELVAGVEISDCDNNASKDSNAVVEKSEDYYKKFAAVSSVADVKVEDVLAFKIVELDENYVPAVSSYKEARVTAINGYALTFEYLSNEVKERTGAFELQDDEIEAESLDQNTEKTFGDLIEPRFVKV